MLGSLLTSLVQDLRYCRRMIQKAPGFSAVAVLVLALGIGATVSMFSAVNAALLTPLPFADPGRLVLGRATSGGRLNPWASAPDYYDYRDRARSFERLAAILPFDMNYTEMGGEEPERVAGTAVSANFFLTLGVTPELGRHFSREDGAAGAANVVIISHGYWQRRFGGLPDAVGRALIIDGNPFTVIGVMPSGFRFMPEVDFWRPMRPDQDAASLRDRHNWLLVGRIHPGVSNEMAQREVDAISAQLAAQYPVTNEGKGLVLADLHDVLVADYTTRLFLLSAAVALAFLIACSNVTGMLLARAPVRRLELSVRAALGASRPRLVRQLVVESLALAAAAGVAGTLLASWLQQVIFMLLRMDIPGLRDAGIAPPVLFFAAGLTVATGILAGVYPAISSARANLAQDLRIGAARVTGLGSRFRNVLIVAQVAVSVVLLIASALLTRSLAMVQAVDPGFEPRGIVTAEIELPRDAYSDPATRTQFFTGLLNGVRALPGVRSVGVVNALPIREPRNVFHVYVPEDPDHERSVFLRAVLPGYFETMRIRVLSGRDVSSRDGVDAPNVGVISGSLARQLFPELDPVGREVVLDFFGGPRTLRVVGVVDDVRLSGLDADPGFAVYVSYYQIPYLAMRLTVRADGEPASVVSAVRDVVSRLDKDIAVAGVTTMEQIVADSVSDRKIVAIALVLYAILPLIFAAAGLYAVLSYDVTRKLREIGIRMALGASARDVIRMILGRGVGLASLGIAIGVVIAFGTTRLIRQVLFGVAPTDVTTFTAVSLLVAGVALVASIVPALRAIRVDPSAALQAE